MYNDDDENDENFEIPNIGHSAYIDTSELTKYLVDHKNEFTILSLNIQSINAKFNYLHALLVELAEKELCFSAVCLQESWLAVNSDVSRLEIPNYKMFHQGKSRCSNHGGLLTYVHCNLSATVRKHFRRSLLWEGRLIDIKGESLITPISICNIYRPPKDNNNNTTCNEPAKRKRLGRSGTFMAQWFRRWTLESATRVRSPHGPLHWWQR